MTQWGPIGQDVFDRTYSRRKPDGSRETWADTVSRVVNGNLALVPSDHHEPDEAERLTELMLSFRAISAGRHLWVGGVPGRQYTFNCHRAGFTDDLATHFCWTFARLMEGGGVGANLSNSYLARLPVPGPVELRVSAVHSHPDRAEFAPRLVSFPGEAVVRLPDTREGWVQGLQLILDTAEAGGGLVELDVSDIRPRGSLIKGFGGVASGPGPLVEMYHRVTETLNACAGRRLTTIDVMDITHEIASCVVSGNVRRSARWVGKVWSDPDVLDTLQAKGDTGAHWTTNVSLEINDDFFTALDAGDPQATVCWEAVIDGMLTTGEPGLFNSSAASVGERGDVRATNPCGEIALEEWEPCCLGHIGLGLIGTDLSLATEAARLMTRFLVRATFADIEDPRQRDIVDANRRIGLGFFDLQAYAAAHGIRYSEIHTSKVLATKLEVIADAARTAARSYSDELGIPHPIKTTTVAPTGTIAKLPGATEGAHPIYSRYFVRRMRYADNDPLLERHVAAGRHIEPCQYAAGTSVVSIVTRDSLLDRFPADLIEQADEISPAVMLATQAFIQKHWSDNATSFTVNVPPDTSRTELSAALRKWAPILKGTTVMADGARPQAPYERIDAETYAQATSATVGQAIDECATGACPVK